MIWVTVVGLYLLIAGVVFIVARRFKPPWMEIKTKWLVVSSLLWGKHVMSVLINGEKK